MKRPRLHALFPSAPTTRVCLASTCILVFRVSGSLARGLQVPSHVGGLSSLSAGIQGIRGIQAGDRRRRRGIPASGIDKPQNGAEHRGKRRPAWRQQQHAPAQADRNLGDTQGPRAHSCASLATPWNVREPSAKIQVGNRAQAKFMARLASHRAAWLASGSVPTSTKARTHPRATTQTPQAPQIVGKWHQP